MKILKNINSTVYEYATLYNPRKMIVNKWSKTGDRKTFYRRGLVTYIILPYVKVSKLLFTSTLTIRQTIVYCPNASRARTNTFKKSIDREKLQMSRIRASLLGQNCILQYSISWYYLVQMTIVCLRDPEFTMKLLQSFFVLPPLYSVLTSMYH